MKGLGESCKNICRKHGVEMYFRGGSTIRDLLVHPKDKDTILKKSGVIYRYKCGRVDCEDEYIGELGRTFGERFREHMKPPSPIKDHQNITGHEVSWTILALWAGRTTAQPETSKRQSTSELMTHPSIGTLASSSCHTSGIRCWLGHHS